MTMVFNKIFYSGNSKLLLLLTTIFSQLHVTLTMPFLHIYPQLPHSNKYIVLRFSTKSIKLKTIMKIGDYAWSPNFDSYIELILMFIFTFSKLFALSAKVT